mgnify:CR=1 FL=1
MNAPVVSYALPATFRKAELTDVTSLLAIEQQCFQSDRLSQRRMRFYVSAPHAEFVVAEKNGQLLGYALLLSRRGTQLTRLYSIAILPEARGQGIAQRLIAELETCALARGKRFMRLEVSEDNTGAIALYKQLGFKQFGMYTEYYADKSDAIRMQKVLSYSTDALRNDIYPWYQQTTEFTCGPAALMMAMANLNASYIMTQKQELAIWRRATTIFMTSGHGGCHPHGLALAASDAGFRATIWQNRALPLFTDGVRSKFKKNIIEVVEQQFADEVSQLAIDVNVSDWRLNDIERAIAGGASVICLISTYAFDKRKAPHWVAVTGMDDRCIYLHDPDPELFVEQVEYQHIPVARDDFLRLASYGKRKIRSAVVIHPA